MPQKPFKPKPTKPNARPLGVSPHQAFLEKTAKTLNATQQEWLTNKLQHSTEMYKERIMDIFERDPIRFSTVIQSLMKN